MANIETFDLAEMKHNYDRMVDIKDKFSAEMKNSSAALLNISEQIDKYDNLNAIMQHYTDYFVMDISDAMVSSIESLNKYLEQLIGSFSMSNEDLTKGFNEVLANLRNNKNGGI